MPDDYFESEPVRLEIDGTLDLHTFSPKDLKYLLPDYLLECHIREIYQVKIIHGKGKGNLRRSVHALLDRNSLVSGYRQADLFDGSWGATVVTLKKKGQKQTPINYSMGSAQCSHQGKRNIENYFSVRVWEISR